MSWQNDRENDQTFFVARRPCHRKTTANDLELKKNFNVSNYCAVLDRSVD